MKKSISSAIILSALVAFAAIPFLTRAAAAPSSVKVIKKGNGWQLLRGGQPYLIKGAGGDGSKVDLKAAGGNSWRTWGADNLDPQLVEAQKLGMTVTVGIWLGHKEHGFDYHDAAAVAAQKEMARKVILRYRSSPALLVWALGNEMENGVTDQAALWNAVEDIAKMAHELDPNHPTMTVVAELGGDKVAQINAHCPDIDIVGINSYGGGPSIGERYQAAGGVKPYIVTEFGPPGTWESEKNAWDVVPELTSTEKAGRYRATYIKSVIGEPLCLGSYAFTWGNKQEATPTWFGLLLPDGSKLGAVDALTELWSGKKAKNLCPVIHSLTLEGSGQTTPGATIKVSLDVSDPENDSLVTTWDLQADPANYGTGGASQTTPPSYPEAVVSSSLKSVTLKMPSYGGAYRLYAYVRDGHGGAAVGNIPLNVKSDTASQLPGAQKAALPFTVYGDVITDAAYSASGYMGNSSAIKMDPASLENPHSGKTCLEVKYTTGDSWGGCVWQSPANDWGDLPGGRDLRGAKKLTFWARGALGGETVNFVFGLLGKDKKFPDSGTGKLDKAVLTTAWKQYSIDLSGTDLSQIKTAFAWSLAGSGQPITFYLDDIKYE